MRTLIIAIGASCLILSPSTFAEQPDLLKPTPQQPLCVDQDTLAQFVLAGMMGLHESPGGCQSIPAGARVEVIERYASGSDFMRMVKVRVTSPKLRGPTIGYTIEIDQ